jgi:CheY-like chemotaxis protein
LRRKAFFSACDQAGEMDALELAKPWLQNKTGKSRLKWLALVLLVCVAVAGAAIIWALRQPSRSYRPESSKALKRLFESAGYGIEITDDGKSALDVVRIRTPTAIILDLRLPVLSGKDVCVRVKQQLSASEAALPIRRV